MGIICQRREWASLLAAWSPCSPDRIQPVYSTAVNIFRVLPCHISHLLSETWYIAITLMLLQIVDISKYIGNISHGRCYICIFIWGFVFAFLCRYFCIFSFIWIFHIYIFILVFCVLVFGRMITSPGVGCCPICVTYYHILTHHLQTVNKYSWYPSSRITFFVLSSIFTPS